MTAALGFPSEPRILSGTDRIASNPPDPDSGAKKKPQSRLSLSFKLCIFYTAAQMLKRQLKRCAGREAEARRGGTAPSWACSARAELGANALVQHEVWVYPAVSPPCSQPVMGALFSSRALMEHLAVPKQRQRQCPPAPCDVVMYP